MKAAWTLAAGSGGAVEIEIALRAGAMDDSDLVAEIIGRAGSGVNAHLAASYGIGA